MLPSLIPHYTNEEQTKITLINPYLEYLGRDVQDPNVVRQEYQADFETKNPEKVDCAIMKDGEPVILIEAKAANSNLPRKASLQLMRYFQAKRGRYAIL